MLNVIYILGKTNLHIRKNMALFSTNRLRACTENAIMDYI